MFIFYSHLFVIVYLSAKAMKCSPKTFQQINFFHNSPGALHPGTPHFRAHFLDRKLAIKYAYFYLLHKGDYTMFRLWAKTFKDNRMMPSSKTLPQKPAPTKFSMHWMRFATSLTWASQSGWMLRSMISVAMLRLDSIRIILWKILNLIIWKFR